MDLEPVIVAAVRAGQDFHIAAGVYPAFDIRNAVPPPGAVPTITADPGVVLQGIVIQGSGPITFSDLELAVDPAQNAAIAIQQGSGLTFSGCNVHGSEVGNGNGFKVIKSPGFTLTNSALHHLAGGVSVTGSDGSTVSGNSFHDLEVDGVQFNASSRVTVAGNHFTDFFPAAGDHSDCIQFQTVGETGPVTGVEITDNIYVRGAGPAGMQGIFMGNETGQPYVDVTIRGNAIVGAIFQGITLDTSGPAAVDDNLVLAYADQPSWLNIRAPAAAITNNRATSFILQGVANPTLRDGNAALAPAAVGDRSCLTAWLSRNAAPAPDPRDAQIAALQAKIAAAQAALT